MSEEAIQQEGGDVESKASRMGWVPLDKFKGDPDKWTDAETFVRRGEEIMPILKKTNEGLRGELAQLRGELSKTQGLFQEAQGALSDFQKYHEEDSKRQYERAMEKLKDDKKDALRMNDVDAVVEIDEAISTLKKQEPIKRVQFNEAELLAAQRNAQPDPTQDPVFQGWVSENKDWFGKDKERTAYADSVAAYVKTMEPNLAGREFLDRVSEEVASRFGLPEKPGRVDRVEGSRGGASRGGNGGKSYSDLPPEAKASCDKFGARLVGDGKAYKSQADWRKQYVRDYFGE